MKIKMLETKQASPDGVNIVLYQKGLIYIVPDKLGADLILVGWAEAVKTKNSGAAPENKSQI